MQNQVEKARSAERMTSAMHCHARRVLAILAVACFGLAAAQVPSGDPSPFIEAEIEVETTVELPAGSTGITTKINVDSDGLGSVLDAVVGALCRIFPCRGNDVQAQAVLRTNEPAIGDARTGIVVGNGAVGIGEVFGGIVTEESSYERGFNVRFARDARVKVRSMSFVRDAFLTDAYLEQLGLDGTYYVAAGTYVVLDDKLTVPVRQRR